MKRAPHVWENKRWCIFCYKSRVQSQLFGNFTAPARYVIQSQHSNVQVTCLNFAGTGSRISLHPLSSSRRVIPSRKIALNSNGEVNYREVDRRPSFKPAATANVFASLGMRRILTVSIA